MLIGVWTALANPGDQRLGAVLRTCGADHALAVIRGGLSDLDAAQELGLESPLAEGVIRGWRQNLPGSEEVFERAARASVSLRTTAEGGIPAQFARLGDEAPVALWTRGDAAALEKLDRSISVVGARAATSYGEHVTMELASTAAAEGRAVVSGGAYGVDGAAHRATIAAGGTTIAILAGGVDRGYPAGNLELFERAVASGGMLISEAPPGAAPTRHRFEQRARLIAAASQATIVVEAGNRSGSLSTAMRAAALGVPVGAVPGPITSAASAGTNRLLREGTARMVTSVQDMAGLADDGAPTRS